MITAIQRSKPYLSVLTVLMLLLSMFIPNVASADVETAVMNADGSRVQMWHEKYNNKGWVYNKDRKMYVETDLIKIDEFNIAYCLEMMYTSPNGHELEPKGRLSDEHYRVLTNGYPNKSNAELGTSSWQESHFATQVALWIVNGDLRYDGIEFKNPRIKTAVDKILNGARNGTEIQDLRFEVTPDHLVANSQDGYKQAGPFEVKTNGKGKFVVEAANAPAGTHFVDAAGNAKNEFETGEKFFVRVSADAPTGQFNIKVTGNLTKTETLWYKSHNQGIQHTMNLVVLEQHPIRENAQVSWISEGIIEIHKTDGNGKNLGGAKFNVMNANGDVVRQIITDDQGRGRAEGLWFEEYTVVEVEAPKGYLKDPTPKKVKVNSKTPVLDFVNKLAEGEVIVKKLDGDNKPLAGVEFQILNEKNEVVHTLTTDNNGMAQVKNLPYGKYKIVESKALPGYISDKTPREFVMNEDKDSHEFQFINNKMKGSVQIFKTDDHNKPLAGVEFTLFKDGKEYKKVTTNKEGIAVVDNLPYGNYVVKETKGLEGYIPSSKEEKFEVKGTDDKFKFVYVNKQIKGSAKVTKNDDAEKPLAGVEFKVYKDGKEYKTIVTNDKGIAELKDLPYGNYTVKESKGLEGYVTDKTEKPFEIKQDGAVFEVTIMNKKIKGSIEIHKKDDSKKPLAGVEFTVYDAKTNKAVTSVKTDAKGIAAVKDLPYGKYYFQETKGLEGYVYDTGKTDFDIKTLNQKQKYDVVNKLIKGKVQVTKVSDEKKPLQGVEFTIYSAKDKKEVAKMVTDKNGVAVSKELPYGEYYLLETKTVTGHVKGTEKREFKVNKDGQLLKYDVINKKIKGNIEILKIDEESKKPLEGVEFGVYDQNNKVIKIVKTGKDGKTKVEGLSYGHYYFKELKTIEGYVINSQKFDFMIEDHGKTLPFEVTNKFIKGNVKLLKVDAENPEVTIEGAVFELRGSTDEVLGEYTSNKDGVIQIENLVFGSYKLVETKAPKGFVLDSKEIPFAVSEDGQTIELQKENHKIYGSLEITKVDMVDGMELPGAKFEVFEKETGKKIVEKVTDEKGKAIFEKLPAGDYMFKETLAPDGYVLYEAEVDFTIKENGEIIRHTIENEKITGSLEITKVDMADGTELPGAKFELFDENNKKIAEKVTDEKGKAVFPMLPKGKYKFKETVAPNGYVLHEAEVEFEITEHNQIIRHTIENEKVPTPEQPKEEKPAPKQPEQPKPELTPEQPKPKEKHVMAATGGAKTVGPLVGLGLIALAGGLYVLKRRNKEAEKKAE
ncbi:SpaA isopeptide-forming pilin-related protein [Bacillus cereus group sp. BfR-BA-01347]|uniref:SpaA isopeptide-forming pilin-related protein n=1 Tax=Bacillus cereus group sp. BfR-BA-01347 TaxID=2920310 RepID=UPI001F5AE5A1|nr:SpaA isopeptide-forming pilin-related protein [Bacillus cereus group sp. BfR-BA-01347]